MADNSHGFVNEDVLIDYINSRTFDVYNDNIKNFLIFLFAENINFSSSFKAQKIGGQNKPDLVIKHECCEKYISLKKGTGNSVHQEKIDVFFSFIEDKLGVLSLNNLKKFHYGDDTLNDKGRIRYSAKECKIRYDNEICELNRVVNKKENLFLFLDRFLFVGNKGDKIVDAIYHGSIDEGLWASREEIINYVCSNEFKMNAVHFGPLSYQVWGRNEKWNAVHPDRRYIMQVKWGSLAKDLKIISEKR